MLVERPFASGSGEARDPRALLVEVVFGGEACCICGSDSVYYRDRAKFMMCACEVVEEYKRLSLF